jgi:DNA-binding transcriptional LysR family regulator
MNKDHPFAERNVVNLEDIPPYEFVCIDPHLVTFPMFNEILERCKIQNSVKFKGADWEILKRFVAAGVGMTGIADICLNEQDKETLVAKSLAQYFPQMHYGVFIKQGRYAPQLENFIDITKSFYSL